MQLQPTSPCPSCHWNNWVRRNRCRNCGADLVQHPDPDVDVEVRLDYSDGQRSSPEPQTP